MAFVVDIEEIIAGLNTKTRQRVQAAKDIVIEKQPTPSIGMNLGLKGGVGYGRQTLIWGNKSAGKSSFCLETVALAQQQGKTCAWIDAEQSYDPAWAARLGVDSDNLIISQEKTIEDMVDIGTHLMRAGVDLIVVDSISSLMPSSWFSKDDELKELSGTKQIGSEARDMANAVRMLSYANENTALILISQIRNQIHSYGASQKPTGGNAVMFFSSTSIRLTSSPREADQHMGSVHSGDKIFQEPIGRPVNWNIEFNKLGPPNITGKYDFYYGGDSIGVDMVGEVVDYAEKYGIIQKGGAWYTVEGERVQGRAKVIDLLKSDPDIYTKVREQLDEQIS
jgi:recombination protein RecA